jgi:ABC-2 type transport system permease protein
MLNLRGIFSVAYKEALHIVRDRRILVLVIVLPPLLTLIFGYAFNSSSITEIPVSIQDLDQSDSSKAFAAILNTFKATSDLAQPTPDADVVDPTLSATDTSTADNAFIFQQRPPNAPDTPDLLREHVQGSLIIPKGWAEGLKNGKPIPLQLYVDGSDTNTGEVISGEIQQALGKYQQDARVPMIENLPQEVIDMGEKLPKDIRGVLSSALEQWNVDTHVLYNPEQRFIDYVIPGIIGLILQLLTVTLMACTIARERESGTLYQLMVTALRRTEIVIGKVLPYLVLSIFLIAMAVGVAHFYFGTQFQRYGTLSLICFLFLCCSLGLGLLISALCQTQTQSIQVAVFYLLPVLMLSGTFSPLEQLPPAIQMISQTFPLTHFCHAFRLVNMHNAGFSFIVGDLLFMLAGTIVACAGAAFLLQRIQE